MPFDSGDAVPLSFLEARWTSLVGYRTGRPPTVETTAFRGVGRTGAAGDGELYEWWWLPEAASAADAQCPPEVLELAEPMRIAEDEELDHVRRYATSLAGAFEAAGDTVELRVRRMNQQVTVAADGQAERDERSVVGVGLRVTRTTPHGPAAVYRSRTYSDVAGLRQAAEALRAATAAALDTAVAAPPVRLDGGRTTVLLAAGTGGPFFHEVCGHPLEGDIVSTGTSYLGRRFGERVAGSGLTVVDDPTHPASNARYRLDDEGCPAQPVHVVEDGVVADVLLDRRTARRLGRRPNGHARRLDFRFPALPRMTHTAVGPGRGTFEELVAPVARGLVAERLTLRHMDVATGEFSFYVLEGRAIERGSPGPPVRPLVIRGNALRVLAAIDAIGEDVEHFAPSGGGCGKLDQGPLFVSFGSPTVRIRELEVAPWA